MSSPAKINKYSIFLLIDRVRLFYRCRTPLLMINITTYRFFSRRGEFLIRRKSVDEKQTQGSMANFHWCLIENIKNTRMSLLRLHFTVKWVRIISRTRVKLINESQLDFERTDHHYRSRQQEFQMFFLPCNTRTCASIFFSISGRTTRKTTFINPLGTIIVDYRRSSSENKQFLSSG